ncbi:MAG: hypothetical protein LBJ57_07475, partial [Prevotellaceae bacterium]|nr:hypothetical protein [Prevotellaceae bacterium]
MKTKILALRLRGIFAGFAFFALSSCSDDFLAENVAGLLLSDSDPTIYVSPKEGTRTHSVRYPAAGDAEFSIEYAPEWLNIVSSTGRFTNGVASISCYASENSAFSQVGIYVFSLILDIKGKGKYAIPACYVSEGFPIAQLTPHPSELQFDSHNSMHSLSIANGGDGILIWAVEECPEWLTVDVTSGVLSLGESRSISVSLSYAHPPLKEKTAGKIVIANNAGGNIVISVAYSVGPPIFSCYYPEVAIYSFTPTASLTFSNNGESALTWRVKQFPAWLTVSKVQGDLDSNEYETMELVCDPSGLSSGEHLGIITIETNDPQLPSNNIT